MFETARDEGALLFLDEADSFLRDRENAVRSWEVTQVNEMLTQMESFDGVFICATNLVDSLDRASLRRFAMKIEFRALKADARWQMFLRLVPAADGDRHLRVTLDRLDGLTPGDFAAVSRQAKLAGAEGDDRAIIAMLENELTLRKRGRGPSGAIGFNLAAVAT
jgi:SpoVK/Ycf46/Vps4 family AAA+-type ATPase